MADVTGKLPRNDEDVEIEDRVWVGANSLVLKGVRIGRRSIVGAGSVVTKSILPYSVAVGKRAKVIRAAFTEDQVAEHERLLFRGR